MLGAAESDGLTDAAVGPGNQYCFTRQFAAGGLPAIGYETHYNIPKIISASPRLLSATASACQLLAASPGAK